MLIDNHASIDFSPKHSLYDPRNLHKIVAWRMAFRPLKSSGRLLHMNCFLQLCTVGTCLVTHDLLSACVYSNHPYIFYTKMLQ